MNIKITGTGSYIPKIVQNNTKSFLKPKLSDLPTESGNKKADACLRNNIKDPCSHAV